MMSGLKGDFLIIAFLCLMVTVPYHVVIQLSTGDSDVQKATLSQMNNLVAALPDIQIELVVHSKGMNFIFKNSHWQLQLEQWIKGNRARLLACNNTLASMHLTKADLMPFVEIIPSAVAHLVKRQHEGWSYLKAGF